jgi:dephospho-CoA kinase
MKQNNTENTCYVLGITGGIGCGKSTVLAYLQERYGAILLETDRIAHQLMEPGQPVYTEVVKNFGKEILHPDGTIDRKKLGAIVFTDETKLELLNSLSHPAVKQYVRDRIREVKDTSGSIHAKKDEQIIVVEAALLLEDHYEAICDEIWYIYTLEDKRRERLKSSRGLTDEKITEILASQSSERFYLDGADRVIHNDGSFAETCAAVDEALKKRMKEKREIQL